MSAALRRRSLVGLLLTLLLGACTASTATPTPTPTATATATPADRTEIDATLAQVEERTARLFGVEPPSGPRVMLLDDAGLRSVLDEVLADPRTLAELARDEALYRVLGYLPDDVDFSTMYEEMLMAGVAGLYRPEIDTEYIRLFGRFSSLEESTASHEFVHYLQDWRYDLDALQAAAAESRDTTLALQALVEGDAAFVQSEYVRRYFNTAQILGMSMSGVVAASRGGQVPAALAAETSLVYLDGSYFVGDVLYAGLTRDELYRAPPVTTEQILHPEKYLAGEVPVPVPPPLQLGQIPSGWSPLPEDRLGEFQLRVWLDEVGAGWDADAAAAGWGGDALQVLQADGRSVALVAAIAWDTGADADEFIGVASTALDETSDAAPLCEGCAYSLWLRDGRAVALLGPTAAPRHTTFLVIAPDPELVRALIEALED